MIRTIAKLRRLLPLVGLCALVGCGGESDEQAKKNPANTPIVQPARPKGTASSDKTTTQKADADRTASGKPANSTIPLGSGFDFYVLSLSWSPSWCDDNDTSGRTAQCAAGKGHGLIVHGLWPQNENGYPSFCSSREPDRVPAELGRTLFDIIPSMGLIGHEWRKHGSCSGLSQKDYFAVLRAARQRLSIPASLQSPGFPQRLAPQAIEAGFISANPGLRNDAVSVTCDGGRLDEIRICLDKALGYRSCPDVDRGGCRAKTIALPAP